MNEKVVRLDGAGSYAAPTSICDEDKAYLIEALERAIQEVKGGQIRGIAIACAGTPGGDYRYSLRKTHGCARLSLLAAVDIMHTALLGEFLE